MPSGVKGLDLVVRNLNKEIAKIQGRSLAGLIEATAHIRTDMDETPPKIPISPGGGFLRGSWFTDPQYTEGGDPIMVCGFHANYAVFVHEMMQSPSGKPINWSRPGSGPRFFMSSIRRNKQKILEIIRNNAEIPK